MPDTGSAGEPTHTLVGPERRRQIFMNLFTPTDDGTYTLKSHEQRQDVLKALFEPIGEAALKESNVIRADFTKQDHTEQ